MPIRSYVAIAERRPGEANWSILFPAFPGVTSVAERWADVMWQAKDALASVVEDMEADRVPLPPAVEDGGLPDHDTRGLHDPRWLLVPVDVTGRATRVNISMDEGLLGRLDDISRRTGMSRSALLARGAKLVIAEETAA